MKGITYRCREHRNNNNDVEMSILLSAIQYEPVDIFKL